MWTSSSRMRIALSKHSEEREFTECCFTLHTGTRLRVGTALPTQITTIVQLGSAVRDGSRSFLRALHCSFCRLCCCNSRNKSRPAQRQQEAQQEKSKPINPKGLKNQNWRSRDQCEEPR